MELYFLRHGPAASITEAGVDRDADRPLTAEGAVLASKEGEGLRRLGLRFAAIASSPLLRARQTAELVARGLGERDRTLVTDALSPGLTLVGLADFIKSHRQGERVMLVGHEPDLSSAVGELCGGARIILRKGGLARVDLEEVAPDAGILRWLVEPEMLALYATPPHEDR